MASTQDFSHESAYQQSHSVKVDNSKPPLPKVDQVGNVEFERLELSDLKPVRVLVQALDNQWLPRAFLPSAFKAGLITDKLDSALKKASRAEYIRALINGQQVIMNRAYLYNNPVVSQDYAKKKGPRRKAFKDLLEKEAIIPYLLGERTPIDPPASGPGTVTGYGADAIAFSNWQELCQESRIHCVRLSWIDQENAQLARQRLADPFNQFATGAAMKNIDQYLQDLRIDSSSKKDLGQRLAEIGQFCLDLRSKDPDKLITRNDLYKAFITAGQNPAERRYDSSKPFASEIKQLLDLAYNCNLPDALGGYLITPVDSLPRIALQEMQQAVKQPDLITGEELLKLLQRTAFDLVGRGLNIKSMDKLSLQDVLEIRNMEEWTAYILSLEALLNNPLQFADGAAARVYENYNRLARQMTNLLKERRANILSDWSPAVELVFYVAGAVLSCLWTTEGPIYQLVGQVAGLVAGAAAPMVARLVIRDMTEKQPEQDLSTGFDFVRFKLPDAKKQWREIERIVKKLPGYRELPGVSREEEIVDPTFNYQIEY